MRSPDRTLKTRSPEASWAFVRESLFFVFLMMIWGGFQNPLRVDLRFNPGGGEAGNSLTQVMWLSLLAAAILITRERWPYAKRHLDFTLFAVFAWCFFTMPLAILPGVSLRRTILTLSVVISIFILIANIERPSTVLRILLIAIVVETITKYIYVFVFPGLGLMRLDSIEPQLVGLWKGQYGHKNNAGAVCAVELIILYAARTRVHWAYLIGLASLELLFLLKSGSKTPAIIVLISLALSTWIIRARSTYNTVISGFFIVLLINTVTAFTTLNDDSNAAVKAVLGSTDFTGRSELWLYLMRYISAHPVTGSGFQSFWQIGQYSPAIQEAKDWIGTAAYGHQGYLDVAASIGIPGLILTLLFVVLRPTLDLARVKQRTDPIFSMYVAFWIFGLLHNGTESNLMNRTELTWVFLVMGLAGIRAQLVSEEPFGRMQKVAGPTSNQRYPSPVPRRPVPGASDV